MIRVDFITVMHINVDFITMMHISVDFINVYILFQHPHAEKKGGVTHEDVSS